jgi:hypothetical protein
MKKIAYTLYVFALIIVLPLVAVLQLNHGSNTSPNIENTSIPSNENVSGHTIVTLQILLSKHFNEPIVR